MVEPQAVQHGGMQIADVNTVLGGVKAELVAFTEVMPGFMPPPANQ